MNNTLLNSTQIQEKKKSLRDILKYFELSENEDTTLQKLWDAVKAVLRGKFIVC